MKKITVLLITLAFAFSFTNVSFAQEQQNTSDTAVTAKKRPCLLYTSDAADER